MENERNNGSCWRNPAIGAMIGGVVGTVIGYLARENYTPLMQALSPLITGSVFALSGVLFSMGYDLRNDLKETEERSSQIETIVGSNK